VLNKVGARPDVAAKLWGKEENELLLEEPRNCLVHLQNRL
jgi:hypothetical protein